jgi:hypothetical protein
LRTKDAAIARIEERFARVEAILEALPDAVRSKLGFQPSSS